MPLGGMEGARRQFQLTPGLSLLSLAASPHHQASHPRQPSPRPWSIDLNDLTTRPVILVVDDNHGVRSVLTHALLDAGYHVITSAGEAEALRVLDQFQTRPDLAVLDLYMPLGSGEEFGRKLLDRDPSLPLVFLSAFGHDPDAMLPGLLFEKPFKLAVLCSAITHVLEVGMAPVVAGTG